MTSAQQKIARVVWQCEQRQEPTLVGDLVRLLGYAAESSLTATLRIMEREGFLNIRGGGEKGRPRVISLTPKGRHALGVGGVPVLGFIPAGPLEEVFTEAEEIVEAILPWQPGDFLLRVRGDSMVGDGILEGDLVLLRPGINPREGEIAAVLVGAVHEATLKHIHFSGGSTILRSSNAKYRDQVIDAEEVKVAGVFRGLIRYASGK